MGTWVLTGARSCRAVQAVSGEPAPADPADGVWLNDVGSIVPVMRAPDGHTFTGTGMMIGYVYTPDGWVRAPRADMDLADYTGLSAGAFPALEVKSPVNRFMLVPVDIGVTGGTEMTTDYICTTRRGDGV